MKNKITVFSLAFLMAVLPSCGGSRLKAPNPKQYAQMRYEYDHILDDYKTELTLAESTNSHAIHRCVLTHADETRRYLGITSGVTGKYQRYTSYPFLEYTADLRATISDLESMSAHLTYPGSSPMMHHLSQEMRSTADQLCQFKGAVIADVRYLQEQDKWDAAQIAKDQQTAMNLLLANTVTPKKVVHEVHVHEGK